MVEQAAPVAAYGIKRLIRDVWGIAGYLEFDHHGHIQRIVLNEAYRLTRPLVLALRCLLGPEQVVITSGET
ncbi:MAG TPA: hypothetical protein VFM49_09245 [Chloroflexia bacterium]|nr:hypothetical protein [Chloroflexia bacterium]